MLDERLVVVQHERHAGGRTRRGGPRVPRARVRLAVGAGVHGHRAELPRKPRDLVGAVTAPDDQPAAALPQPPVEIAQALEQEPHARRCAILAAVDAGIEHEGARDREPARERGCDRRLVVQPEIAAEPDEGGLPDGPAVGC